MCKPLRTEMKIKKEGWNWIWVDIKYERLPTFCFLCGRIDHGDKLCEKNLEQDTMSTTKPFGPWLGAVSRPSQISYGAKWLVEVGGETSTSEGGEGRP